MTQNIYFIFIYLFVCLFIYLFIHLFIYLFIYLFEIIQKIEISSPTVFIAVVMPGINRVLGRNQHFWRVSKF